MSELKGILLVLFLLVLSLGSLVKLRRYFGLGGELTRKIAHVVTGLVSLGFPWLFDSTWPVILLCALSLLAMRWLRNQKNDLRKVLHAVERKSYGEFCLPLAITILFVLKDHTIQDYFIPILLLTLADAVGAMVGTKYGTSKYTTDEGHKSIEGSVAFFVVAFLSTHIPLLLGTDAGRLESILIASIIGLIIMLVEAIAWRGLDNLFIPLGAYMLLDVYGVMTPQELGGRILILFVILLFFSVIKKRSYAKDATLLAGVLTLYHIWVVAGVYWIMTPIIMAVAYSIMCPPNKKQAQIRHGLHDLGAVVGAGYIWMFLSISYGMPELILPYVASWSAQIGMIFAAYTTHMRPHSKEFMVVTYGSLLGLIGALPTLILSPDVALSYATVLLFFFSVGISTWLLWRFEWVKRGNTYSQGRCWRQLTYGFAPSVVCSIPVLL